MTLIYEQIWHRRNFIVSTDALEIKTNFNSPIKITYDFIIFFLS